MLNNVSSSTSRRITFCLSMMGRVIVNVFIVLFLMNLKIIIFICNRICIFCMLKVVFIGNNFVYVFEIVSTAKKIRFDVIIIIVNVFVVGVVILMVNKLMKIILYMYV